MNSHLAVVSLHVDDIARAVHFYRDIIGLYLIPESASRPHFRLDGTYLVLLQGKPQPALEVHNAHFPIIAFSVDDLDGAIDRLRANKVELPWGVEADARARWVRFYDPAGNLIELVQSLRGVV